MTRLLRIYIIYTTIEDVPVALFLTINRVCEVLTRQNQSVQLRFYIYMSAHPIPYRSFSMGKTLQK